MIKTLNKLELEGNYPNIIKGIIEKPMANITVSGERLKLFRLRSGTRQGCPFLPLLFNTVLEVLAQLDQKKKKGIKKRKRSKILSVHRWHDYIYKTLKIPHEKLLEPNKFNKVAEHKISTQRSVAFLYTNHDHCKKETEKTIPFTIVSERI